jgi:hypothetical protein
MTVYRAISPQQIRINPSVVGSVGLKKKRSQARPHRARIEPGFWTERLRSAVAGTREFIPGSFKGTHALRKKRADETAARSVAINHWPWHIGLGEEGA